MKFPVAKKKGIISSRTQDGTDRPNGEWGGCCLHLKRQTGPENYYN